MEKDSENSDPLAEKQTRQQKLKGSTQDRGEEGRTALNSSVNWSTLLPMLIGFVTCSNPISSSAIEIFFPFGVSLPPHHHQQTGDDAR